MEVLEAASSTAFRNERDFTAIDFFPRFGTLLTVNIGEVKWRQERFLDVSFLQPIDPSGAIVRPLGGTPRPRVIALTSRHLSLEFVSCPQVIRLRIIAPFVPLIRTLGSRDPAGENRVLIAGNAGPLS